MRHDSYRRLIRNRSRRQPSGRLCGRKEQREQRGQRGTVRHLGIGLRVGDPARNGELADAAAELEELGHGPVWLGGNTSAHHAVPLLDATSHITVATGIQSIWQHEAADTAVRSPDWRPPGPAYSSRSATSGRPETSATPPTHTALREGRSLSRPAWPAIATFQGAGSSAAISRHTRTTTTANGPSTFGSASRHAGTRCTHETAHSAVAPPSLIRNSGIRSGADIIKAIALGATAVGIGRPYAYGLALGGTDGIVHVLRSLLAEADLIMAVDGYPTLGHLTPEALQRVM